MWEKVEGKKGSVHLLWDAKKGKLCIYFGIEGVTFNKSNVRDISGTPPYHGVPHNLPHFSSRSQHKTGRRLSTTTTGDSTTSVLLHLRRRALSVSIKYSDDPLSVSTSCSVDSSPSPPAAAASLHQFYQTAPTSSYYSRCSTSRDRRPPASKSGFSVSVISVIIFLLLSLRRRRRRRTQRKRRHKDVHSKRRLRTPGDIHLRRFRHLRQNTPTMEENNVDEEEFEFSRNYFLAKESGKSGKKSARKLSEIDLVDEQDLRAAVLKIEPKHEKEIASLRNSYKSMYDEWVFELRYGFGLLMYGFGSKKALIEDFASTALTEYGVIVVNGYLQSINLKQVVIAMAEVLWDQLKTHQKSTSGGLHKDQHPFNTRSMDDLIAFLDGLHAEGNECLVCLVIHNIDGPGLRDSDTQHLLARIAACSHVRVVASIDHVNAPLLWDKKMVHVQFNWWWHHVPTFAPYKIEGVFYPLILAHGGTSQSVKTASIVLQSLTPNAQNVFKVLAEYQLAHPDEEGMQIDVLFTSCREQFLVSSQVTLNSHLTEFKDHELVKLRRHSDGQDCLYIPLSKDALEKLVLEINQ